MRKSAALFLALSLGLTASPAYAQSPQPKRKPTLITIKPAPTSITPAGPYRSAEDALASYEKLQEKYSQPSASVIPEFVEPTETPEMTETPLLYEELQPNDSWQGWLEAETPETEAEARASHVCSSSQEEGDGEIADLLSRLNGLQSPDPVLKTEPDADETRPADLAAKPEGEIPGSSALCELEATIAARQAELETLQKSLDERSALIAEKQQQIAALEEPAVSAATPVLSEPVIAPAESAQPALPLGQPQETIPSEQSENLPADATEPQSASTEGEAVIGESALTAEISAVNIPADNVLTNTRTEPAAVITSQPEAPVLNPETDAQKTALERELQTLLAAQQEEQSRLEGLQTETAGLQKEEEALKTQPVSAASASKPAALPTAARTEPAEAAVSGKAEAAITPESEVVVQSAAMPGNTPNLHQIKAQVSDLEARSAAGESGLQPQIEGLKEQLKALETLSVYRLYNPNSGEHFYTPSANERDVLAAAGWKYEGVGWRSPKNDTSNPIYRLYNPSAGDHHYTLDANEKNTLAALGWRDEGVAWYSDPFQGVEIYRAYNPNAKTGAHHFTDSAPERDTLVGYGWKNEGVGFYARFLYSICQENVDGTIKQVWYDENDRRLSGEQKINGSWYSFDPNSGAMQQGLVSNDGGATWRYYGPDGRNIRGRQTIEGKAYSFDAQSGVMVKNKLVSYGDGTICYYQNAGSAATGTFSLANATFTADGSGNILSATLGGVPHFMQSDPSWANATVNGRRFVLTGCAATVLASAISALTNTRVSPYGIGVMLGNAGLMNITEDGAGGAGMVWGARQYAIPTITSISMEQARRTLRAGGIIAAAVNPGSFCPLGATHELLVYGYSNDYAYIHDPYGWGADGWYPLSVIFEQRSTSGYDCQNGGPTFGLQNTRLPW